MENFENLLDKYIDENQIKEKIKLDIKKEQEEVKIMKDKKVSDKFLRTISINEFVNYYLGSKHNCQNLKHKGLKSFENPYVVGISNEFAIKNPDCITRNEIVVVIDAYGNPGTYINPELLKNIQNMEEYKRILNIWKNVHIHDFEDIQTLYSEFSKIMSKINALEEQYINSCDLLNLLQKKSILREIKKYVVQAEKTQIEFIKTQKEMIESISFESKFLEELENISEIDSSTDEYENICDNKLNRQKKFIQKNKRNIIRKEN